VGRNRTKLAVPRVTGMVFERVLGFKASGLRRRSNSPRHYESRKPRFGDAISRISRDCVRSAVLTSSRWLTAAKSATAADKNKSQPRHAAQRATTGDNPKSKPRPEDEETKGNQHANIRNIIIKSEAARQCFFIKFRTRVK